MDTAPSGRRGRYLFLEVCLGGQLSAEFVGIDNPDTMTITEISGRLLSCIAFLYQLTSSTQYLTPFFPQFDFMIRVYIERQ